MFQISQVKCSAEQAFKGHRGHMHAVLSKTHSGKSKHNMQIMEKAWSFLVTLEKWLVITQTIWNSALFLQGPIVHSAVIYSGILKCHMSTRHRMWLDNVVSAGRCECTLFLQLQTTLHFPSIGKLSSFGDSLCGLSAGHWETERKGERGGKSLLLDLSILLISFPEWHHCWGVWLSFDGQVL